MLLERLMGRTRMSDPLARLFHLLVRMSNGLPILLRRQWQSALILLSD
jgi:hypothetical protein